MNINEDKLRLWVYSIFIFAALVIMTDFILPGKVFHDEIINVKKERQQYYNAARNYHYSYRVITSNHNFFVKENFAQKIQKNQKIEYTVSRVFNEVNSYGLIGSEGKGIYSLRILSGIIIPFVLIVTLAIAYQNKKKSSILVFVIQVLLIADLVFLMI